MSPSQDYPAAGRQLDRPVAPSPLDELLLPRIDARVAGRARLRCRKELHDPRVGIHRRKRLAVGIAPTAQQKARRSEFDRHWHDTQSVRGPPQGVFRRPPGIARPARVHHIGMCQRRTLAQTGTQASLITDSPIRSAATRRRGGLGPAKYGLPWPSTTGSDTRRSGRAWCGCTPGSGRQLRSLRRTRSPVRERHYHATCRHARSTQPLRRLTADSTMNLPEDSSR